MVKEIKKLNDGLQELCNNVEDFQKGNDPKDFVNMVDSDFNIIMEACMHKINDIMEKNEALLRNILLHIHEGLRASRTNLKGLHDFLESQKEK